MSERAPDQLRTLRIVPDFTDAPLASVLMEAGDTRVLCTASLEESVPRFRQDSGGGWLTAEYGMLPGSSPYRIRRAASRGRPDGRSTEIQRLIGRSLRAAFDLDAMPELTLWIDCDVLQADGGTRTASITGGYVAARLALERLIAQGRADRRCLLDPVAAVSVGVVSGEPVLDLDYPLDSAAEVDMNVVVTGQGRFIEVQGTAEGAPFTRAELDKILDAGWEALQKIFAMQREALSQAGVAWQTVGA